MVNNRNPKTNKKIVETTNKAIIIQIRTKIKDVLYDRKIKIKVIIIKKGNNIIIPKILSIKESAFIINPSKKFVLYRID